MGKTTRQKSVEITTPPLHLPDANSTAEDVLNKALEFCTRKMRLQDSQMTIERLQQSDHSVCEYCQYSIAEQVGAALGALDENVKAVYLFEYEATPEDVAFSETAGPPLVHLLVWGHRRTETLKSLLSMLDRALATSYAELIGPSQLQHLLDAQIIDDEDVEKRIGYAALLYSLYHRPLKVWEH